MRRKYFAVAGLVCLSLVAVGLGSARGDREYQSLAKRVAKLEKENAGLKKTLASLEDSVSSTRKDIAAVRKELSSTGARSDARTLLLAEWFDDYHRRESFARYHREHIRRKK